MSAVLSATSSGTHFKEVRVLSDLEFAGYCRHQIEDIEMRLRMLKEIEGPTEITIKIEYRRKSTDEFTGSGSRRESLQIELKETEDTSLSGLIEKLAEIANLHKEAVRKEMDTFVDDYIKGRAIAAQEETGD
jgi:hypothetical protein